MIDAKVTKPDTCIKGSRMNLLQSENSYFEGNRLIISCNIILRNLNKNPKYAKSHIKIVYVKIRNISRVVLH